MASSLFQPLRRTMSQGRTFDHLADKLDEMQSKAEKLRTDVLELEAEQAKLRSLLSRLSSSEEVARCYDVDREEIEARVAAIQRVLDSVRLFVETPRDDAQAAAWQHLQEQMSRMRQRIEAAEAAGERPPVEELIGWVGAASKSESFRGPVDSRVQGWLLGCALGDQKVAATQIADLMSAAQQADARVARLSADEKARRKAAAAAAAASASASSGGGGEHVAEDGASEEEDRSEAEGGSSEGEESAGESDEREMQPARAARTYGGAPAAPAASATTPGMGSRRSAGPDPWFASVRQPASSASATRMAAAAPPAVPVASPAPPAASLSRGPGSRGVATPAAASSGATGGGRSYHVEEHHDDRHAAATTNGKGKSKDKRRGSGRRDSGGAGDAAAAHGFESPAAASASRGAASGGSSRRPAPAAPAPAGGRDDEFEHEREHVPEEEEAEEVPVRYSSVASGSGRRDASGHKPHRSERRVPPKKERYHEDHHDDHHDDAAGAAGDSEFGHILSSFGLPAAGLGGTGRKAAPASAPAPATRGAAGGSGGPGASRYAATDPLSGYTGSGGGGGASFADPYAGFGAVPAPTASRGYSAPLDPFGYGSYAPGYGYGRPAAAAQPARGGPAPAAGAGRRPATASGTTRGQPGAALPRYFGDFGLGGFY